MTTRRGAILHHWDQADTNAILHHNALEAHPGVTVTENKAVTDLRVRAAPGEEAPTDLRVTTVTDNDKMDVMPILVLRVIMRETDQDTPRVEIQVYSLSRGNTPWVENGWLGKKTPRG